MSEVLVEHVQPAEPVTPPSLKLPTFIEAHAHNVQCSYYCTNEEPELHAKLLGKRRFTKAAGICSGGEIPLFTLLPRCEEVYAVDHAMGALAITWLKSALLAQVGYAGLRKLAERHTDQPGFLRVVEPLLKGMPEALRKITQVKPTAGAYSYKPPYTVTFGAGVLQQLRKELHFAVRPTSAVKTVSRLDKLTLIHGDISDLATWGPYDLLYVSNAMGHSGRKGVPHLVDFAPLVRAGGFLLFTGTHGVDKDWEQVASVSGYRTAWQHVLFRRKKG